MDLADELHTQLKLEFKIRTKVTGRQSVFNEALVGVIRIRDSWVKNFRDMGHLRNKLIWDISKFTWQPGGQSDIV